MDPRAAEDHSRSPIGKGTPARVAIHWVEPHYPAVWAQHLVLFSQIQQVLDELGLGGSVRVVVGTVRGVGLVAVYAESPVRLFTRPDQRRVDVKIELRGAGDGDTRRTDSVVP